MNDVDYKWVCDNCRKPSENPMKCSKCNAATYCNKNCQKEHWQEHKKVCCIDIVSLSPEENIKLVSELVGIIKSDEDLYMKILLSIYNNLKKRITVVSVIRDRKINKFEQPKVFDMTIPEYCTITKSESSQYNYDSNLYIIIMSERNQVMVNGVIPLSHINKGV
jgi:hypothetical protein